MDLNHVLDRDVDVLSGGELQRFAIGVVAVQKVSFRDFLGVDFCVLDRLVLYPGVLDINHHVRQKTTSSMRCKSLL